MKLFQNLSTDLAEEVVKSLFLFIALAAILFDVAESFEQFRCQKENRYISQVLYKDFKFIKDTYSLSAAKSLF